MGEGRQNDKPVGQVHDSSDDPRAPVDPAGFWSIAGAVNKRLTPAYLPIEAFAYITFYLKQHQPSGAKLIDLLDWELFFLPPEGVERLLVEAHQQGLLEYHAAGTVARLTFPSNSLEDYAYVLAETAH
jgi:hypothetical protein